MRISDWSSDVCSSDLQFLDARHRLRREIGPHGDDYLAVGQLHDQGVFRIAGLSPGRWGQAGQQLTWQQQTGQQAENKKMPAVHTKLLTRKIRPKSATEDQPWRSEERRVRKEGVSRCKYRWSPEH